MAKVRGAVIGCGFFAGNHLNGWAELRDHCDIVAVCDRDGAKAKAAAERFGIPACYTDATAMLGAVKPDFVDIITTVETHRKLVELCAAHGVGIIVQKPLALDWADASALVGAAEKARVPIMVHENFRFQKPVLRAREILASGEIGEPTWARFSWRTNFDVYAGQPYLAKTERFILMDIGVHVLDVARAVLGEVASVYCQTRSIKPGIAGEDMATVLLRHESGVTSVNDFTYESRHQPDPFPDMLLEVEGTEGALRLGVNCQITVSTKAGARTETVALPALAWATPPWLIVQDSVVTTQREWLASLAEGRQAQTSGADNLRTFALVEACYESARTSLPATPAKPA
jgi:predicted dehydrogenase